MNYTLKIYFKNGKVRRVEKKNSKAFLYQIRTINWLKSKFVGLRVYYGTFKNAFGKMSGFINEGIYTSKKEFNQTLAAFLAER